MAQHAAILAARYFKCMALADSDAEAAEATARRAGWAEVAATIRAIGLGETMSGGAALAARLKATSAPSTMSDFAAATSAVSTDFAEAVRSASLLGRLTKLRAAPLNTRMVRAGRLGRARFVAEGEPVRVVAGSFETESLPPAKCSAISVQTLELLRDSSVEAEGIIAADLVAAAAQEIDRIFASPVEDGTGDNPEGIFHGVEEISFAGSWDAALEGAMAAFSDAGVSLAAGAWIGPQRLLTHMQLLRDGGALLFPSMSNTTPMLLGLPFVASSAIEPVGSPGELVLGLLAQDQILRGTGGAELAVSRSAAVQMNDSPSDGPQPLLSLWQAHCAGAKATIWVNWRRRRRAAAAAVRGFAL